MNKEDKTLAKVELRNGLYMKSGRIGSRAYQPDTN